MSYLLPQIPGVLCHLAKCTEPEEFLKNFCFDSPECYEDFEQFRRLLKTAAGNLEFYCQYRSFISLSPSLLPYTELADIEMELSRATKEVLAEGIANPDHEDLMTAQWCLCRALSLDLFDPTD